MNTDINHIIRQSIKGDKNYQEILLKRLRPLIYKNIYANFIYRHEILDLVQEGYVFILESLSDYDDSNSHFLQYIKIRLHYFYKNYNRKYIKHFSNVKLINSEILFTNNYISPLEMILLKEKQEILHACMKKLPKRERNILYLYYFKEYSIKEISEKLKLPRRKISYCKYNALIKLKYMLIKLL